MTAESKSNRKERRTRCKAVLHEYGRTNIFEILGFFPSVHYEQVMSSTRLAHVVNVRYLVIAFLYHACLMEESQQAVADYLSKPQNTVSKAITAIDRASRGRGDRLLIQALDHMCTNLGFERAWFTAHRTRKRPRP